MYRTVFKHLLHSMGPLHLARKQINIFSKMAKTCFKALRMGTDKQYLLSFKICEICKK